MSLQMSMPFLLVGLLAFDGDFCEGLIVVHASPSLLVGAGTACRGTEFF